MPDKIRYEIFVAVESILQELQKHLRYGSLSGDIFRSDFRYDTTENALLNLKILVNR